MYNNASNHISFLTHVSMKGEPAPRPLHPKKVKHKSIWLRIINILSKNLGKELRIGIFVLGICLIHKWKRYSMGNQWVCGTRDFILGKITNDELSLATFERMVHTSWWPHVGKKSKWNWCGLFSYLLKYSIFFNHAPNVKVCPLILHAQLYLFIELLFYKKSPSFLNQFGFCYTLPP